MGLASGALAQQDSAAALPPPATLRILHFNDLDEITPDRNGFGGIAELKTLIDRHQGNADAVLVTFGGDTISPSVLSSITQGAHMIEFLNALGTDLAVPGNHEYDFGTDVFERRVAESDFPWIGTNIRTAAGAPVPGLPEHHTLSVGAYSIGVIGLLTPDTETVSNPGGIHQFLPVIETAQAAVQALEADGMDVIIALTHTVLSEEKALADAIPAIDLILGGHDHHAISDYTGTTLILESGAEGRYLGIVDLHIETVDGRNGPFVRITPEWQMALNRSIEPDPALQAMVDRYQDQLDAELGETIGTSETALDSRRQTVRQRESNMGNLIADAMIAATDAEIALTNGGGIRGDLERAAPSPLTRRDILSELPFGNVVVVLEATGADIRATLEHGVSALEDGAGRFLQVSAGLSVTFDPTAPVGQRIVSVTFDGAALDETRTYRLATNEYLAGGGDGFDMLLPLPRLIDGAGATLLATQVMDYIAANTPVAPVTEGRLIIQSPQ